MKLKYLQTAQAGAHWFKSYYRQRPQLNYSKARAALLRAEQMLQNSQHPIGKEFEDRANVWEYSIQETAFSLLYTIANGTIWIIDIRDQRGFRSAASLRRFNRELRNKFNIPD